MTRTPAAPACTAAARASSSSALAWRSASRAAAIAVSRSACAGQAYYMAMSQTGEKAKPMHWQLSSQQWSSATQCMIQAGRAILSRPSFAYTISIQSHSHNTATEA